MARCSTVDPLERFRFRVEWTAETGESATSEATSLVRFGFHDVQMPKRATTKITYREGIDPDINQISAGLSSMEDIVLSRGVIAADDNNEFYKWISAVHNPTAGHVGRDSVSARNSDAAANCYKKDLTIKMYGRNGDVARVWVLYNAFPVNFVPGSDLDASEDGDKALESLTIGYEDFKEMAIDGLSSKAVSGSL